jgi:hypothetical protein
MLRERKKREREKKKQREGKGVWTHDRRLYRFAINKLSLNPKSKKKMNEKV